MFFKRKRKKHPIFGEMILDSGYWSATATLEYVDSRAEIEVLLNKDFFDELEVHANIWIYLTQEIQSIKIDVASKITEGVSNDTISFDIDQNFSQNMLDLEQLTIEASGEPSVFLMWGIKTNGSNEFDYGIHSTFYRCDVSVFAEIH